MHGMHPGLSDLSEPNLPVMLPDLIQLNLCIQHALRNYSCTCDARIPALEAKEYYRAVANNWPHIFLQAAIQCRYLETPFEKPKQE